jgi:hypothetical protein
MEGGESGGTYDQRAIEGEEGKERKEDDERKEG